MDNDPIYVTADSPKVYPVEYIGGPLDGQHSTLPTITNLTIARFGDNANPLTEGETVHVYQIDETETKYLFRGSRLFSNAMFK